MLKIIAELTLLAAAFIALLAYGQASAVRSRARKYGVEVRGLRLAAVSVLSTVSGLVVGGALGYAVMFGPSHLTGDFIGLPWFTMIPALIVGFWSAVQVSDLSIVLFLAMFRG